MSDQGFFSRWAQRKQQVHEEKTTLKEAADIASSEQERAITDNPASHAQALTPDVRQQANSAALPPDPTGAAPADDLSAPADNLTTPADNLTAPLSDDDMPDVTSIDGNTNVSAFFSEGVSEKLRKQALKAMFLKPEFNIRDGMDDYDLDYTDVKELSSDVASGLRNWFKNKDPLNLEGNQDVSGEAAVAAVDSTDASAHDANGSTENTATEIQETGSQGDTSEAKQPSDQSMTDEPHPEPDQYQTDLASGKATTADSAPAQDPS